MKTLLILLFVIVTSYRSFAQDCSKQHYNIAKYSLISAIGINTYNLKNKGDKILFLEFVCDTLGNVLKISNCKVFDKKISKKQFASFRKKFCTTKMDICNPEPEISNFEYFRMNNYNPKYSVLLKAN